MYKYFNNNPIFIFLMTVSYLYLLEKLPLLYVVVKRKLEKLFFIIHCTYNMG